MPTTLNQQDTSGTRIQIKYSPRSRTNSTFSFIKAIKISALAPTDTVNLMNYMPNKILCGETYPSISRHDVILEYVTELIQTILCNQTFSSLIYNQLQI